MQSIGSKTVEELVDIVRREANLIDRLYLILAQNGLADCAGDDFENEVFEVANKIESIDGGIGKMETATIIDLLAKVHFTSYKWIMILPCALMAIDIVTGFLGSWFVLKNFESAKMRAGLVKKVGEILIILIGILFTVGMELPTYILKAISLYILLMECLSVVENLDKMGVPLPKFLKNFVNNVHNSIQNDSYDELKAKYMLVQAELQKYKLSGIMPAIDTDDLK